MSWGRVQDVLGKLDGFLSKKNIDAGGGEDGLKNNLIL